jgi:hypothetical protein
MLAECWEQLGQRGQAQKAWRDWLKLARGVESEQMIEEVEARIQRLARR